MTVKLWDIEKGMNINTLSAHEQLIQDIVWDYYGTTYATSCKDKCARIIDARSPQVAQASFFFAFLTIGLVPVCLHSRQPSRVSHSLSSVSSFLDDGIPFTHGRPPMLKKT